MAPPAGALVRPLPPALLGCCPLPPPPILGCCHWLCCGRGWPRPPLHPRSPAPPSCGKGLLLLRCCCCCCPPARMTWFIHNDVNVAQEDQAQAQRQPYTLLILTPATGRKDTQRRQASTPDQSCSCYTPSWVRQAPGCHPAWCSSRQTAE